MSDLIRAAEAIDRLAIQYELMVTASAALKRIGSLEEAEEAARNRLMLLRDDEETSKARLADLESKASHATDAMAVAAKAAKSEHEAVAKKAANTADEIIESARNQAQQIITAAVAEAQRETDEARVQAHGIKAATAELTEGLAEIENQILSRQVALSALTQRMTEMRAAAAQFAANAGTE